MNIVVTWPKSRSLKSYLDAIERAKDREHLAFFKLSGCPRVAKHERCYHVHDGFVRGFLPIHSVIRFDEDAPVDDMTGAQFVPGIYVVRFPFWYPSIREKPMRGFQGFRYA